MEASKPLREDFMIHYELVALRHVRLERNQRRRSSTKLHAWLVDYRAAHPVSLKVSTTSENDGKNLKSFVNGNA